MELNVKRKRRPIRENKKIQRLMNQEDLLIEISERLALEMKALGITDTQLAETLDQDISYVEGLLHGFANITVRELADVFTVFQKVVALSLVGSNEAQKSSISTVEIGCHVDFPFSSGTVILEGRGMPTNLTHLRFKRDVSQVIHPALIDDSQKIIGGLTRFISEPLPIPEPILQS